MASLIFKYFLSTLYSILCPQFSDVYVDLFIETFLEA